MGLACLALWNRSRSVSMGWHYSRVIAVPVLTGPLTDLDPHAIFEGNARKLYTRMQVPAAQRMVQVALTLAAALILLAACADEAEGP